MNENKDESPCKEQLSLIQLLRYNMLPLTMLKGEIAKKRRTSPLYLRPFCMRVHSHPKIKTKKLPF